MILCFTLSMPNVGSWNGKWSGEDNLYARIVNFGNSKKGIARADYIRGRSPFRYNFGDGWSANVSVEVVGAREAARLRKASKGFCGYDWMIDSIRQHGDIRVEKRTAQASA